MVALRPDEWKPTWSSASSTVTLAWGASAAAADRPAIPPPTTRMSDLFITPPWKGGDQGMDDGPTEQPSAARPPGPSLPGRGRSLRNQPLVDDLAVLGQADAFDDFVVVREHGPGLLLVPEGSEEIVEVAREQRRGVGGEA